MSLLVQLLLNFLIDINTCLTDLKFKWIKFKCKTQSFCGLHRTLTEADCMVQYIFRQMAETLHRLLEDAQFFKEWYVCHYDHLSGNKAVWRRMPMPGGRSSHQLIPLSRHFHLSDLTVCITHPKGKDLCACVCICVYIYWMKKWW